MPTNLNENTSENARTRSTYYSIRLFIYAHRTHTITEKLSIPSLQPQQRGGQREELAGLADELLLAGQAGRGEGGAGPAAAPVQVAVLSVPEE